MPRMKLLFVADLHYSLKQFDWLLAQAPKFDAVSSAVSFSPSSVASTAGV